MKALCGVLWLLGLVSCAKAQPLVSIERFKKITDPDERERIVAQAPPQQREELASLDKYLMLTAHDKATGSQVWKESAIIKLRGFKHLEELFFLRGSMWLIHLGETLQADLDAGVSLQKRQEVERRGRRKTDAFGALVPQVHSLVYHLAATPQALRLEKQAEALCAEIESQTVNTPGLPTPPPLTDRERRELSRQVDRIFAEMKRLPTLTSAQLWKEYDELPAGEYFKPKGPVVP